MAHFAPLLPRVSPFLLALACLAGAPGAYAQSSGSAPAAPAAGAKPATPAPAPTPAATPTPAPKKTFVVKVPPGGKYVISIPEAGTPPVQASGDQATLEVPANASKFTLSVVDEQSGYAARREMEAASVPAEVALTPADMKLVHLVKLRITGQGEKPVANGVVILTDSLDKVHQFQLTPAQAGEIQVLDVAQGKAAVMVAPLNASPTTKEVQVTLQKGETFQTIPVGLPEVTAVVDTPATAAPTPAPATTGAAPTPQPPAPAPQPTPGPPNQPGGASQFFQTLLGFIILGAVGYGVYAYGKKQGWTVEGMMEKLGVQPQTTVAGAPGPGPAPAPAPPPPVVADPNRCQFCGEIKDTATGACACTLGSGAAAAPAFAAAGGAATAISQPRLVAASGLYLGEIFPISGEAVIGRDPMNSIPLDRDTTVSRRHARILQDAGGFRIVDEGSSNGTFVNGAKVTESALRPGDEVSIGGTRFRFEA